MRASGCSASELVARLLPTACRYKRDSSELHSLANLEMLIDGAKARAHAQAFVKSLLGGAVVAEAGEARALFPEVGKAFAL